MEPLEDHVEITPDPLSLDALVARVHSPSAGAIVTFVGTTRDVFEGKPVDRLEYECYAPMAEKKMRELVVMARERWDVVKVAIAHRTGTVAVGESSVIIAVSSAHRADALEATPGHRRTQGDGPIWKKEFEEGCGRRTRSSDASRGRRRAGRAVRLGMRSRGGMNRRFRPEITTCSFTPWRVEVDRAGDAAQLSARLVARARRLTCSSARRFLRVSPRHPRSPRARGSSPQAPRMSPSRRVASAVGGQSSR